MVVADLTVPTQKRVEVLSCASFFNSGTTGGLSKILQPGRSVARGEGPQLGLTTRFTSLWRLLFLGIGTSEKLAEDRSAGTSDTLVMVLILIYPLASKPCSSEVHNTSIVVCSCPPRRA